VLSGDKARVKGRGSREKPTGGPLDDFFFGNPKVHDALWFNQNTRLQISKNNSNFLNIISCILS
jgi:hypothetical protein